MIPARNLRRHLDSLVVAAIERAIAAGDLPEVAIPAETVERPKDPNHGDYASTAALRLARAAMRPPLAVAEAIAKHLPPDETVEPPAIAPPGFLNFRLAASYLQDSVDAILREGPAFADLDIGKGKRAQVEFVSANPTGPLHVGNGRGAAIGDTLAALLQAAGFEVEREYYVNDAGTQAEVFAETLYARYQQLFGREVEIPAEGYPGAYMIEIAERIRAEAGDRYLRAPGEPAAPEFGERGIAIMLEQIRSTLERFGVRYDRWYSERSLYRAGGPYERAMAILRERGFLVEREGALWFASSELGESKDNVVVRSDGRPTYYASDIAYHYEKFVERGFDLVIDVWGADHHGHVSRLKTAVGALGIDPARLHILLYQLVTLKRGGEVVRLSKRGGDIITLDELLDEVGPDAARFFFLQRSPGAQMDFDLDLAVKQSNENPVYYVQYAHARLSSILQRAAEQGLSPDGGNVRLLGQPHELGLVREMLKLPEVIESCVATFEPHPLPQYAIDLATAFHTFNDAFKQQGDPALKVITQDEELSRARLKLVAAARLVLARVLNLMGMSAPERM